MPRLTSVLLAAAAAIGGAAAVPDQGPATCQAPGIYFQPSSGRDDPNWQSLADVSAWRNTFSSSLSGSSSTVELLGYSGYGTKTWSLNGFGDVTIQSGTGLHLGYPRTSGPPDGTTFTFSEPHQAVSLVMLGADNYGGGRMTVTCASGASETVDLPLAPEGSIRPAYFSTVRNAADPSDWCVALTVVPASGGDGVMTAAFEVGSCDDEPPVVGASYPCDCPAVSVSSEDGLSATLSFSETPTEGCPQ